VMTISLSRAGELARATSSSSAISHR
jgi:hypothetical protein